MAILLNSNVFNSVLLYRLSDHQAAIRRVESAAKEVIEHKFVWLIESLVLACNHEFRRAWRAYSSTRWWLGNSVMNTVRTALLIIDVQNDFCPGGALEVADGSDVVPIVNALQSRFDITVLTQDWHPRDHKSFASNHREVAAFSVIEMPYGAQVLWPDHCVQGSRGAAFHPDLDTNRANLIVRKGFRPEIDSYSAFFENDKTTPTGLSGYLREREVDQVVLAGLATDFCVAYSALDARRLGFEATIIEDACRAIDIDGSLASAMSDMQAQGVHFELSHAVV